MEAAGSGENALRYLARYVFKTATGNRPLDLLSNGKVRWPYRSSQTRQWTHQDFTPEKLTCLPAGRSAALSSTSCPKAIAASAALAGSTPPEESASIGSALCSAWRRCFPSPKSRPGKSPRDSCPRNTHRCRSARQCRPRSVRAVKNPCAFCNAGKPATRRPHRNSPGLHDLSPHAQPQPVPDASKRPPPGSAPRVVAALFSTWIPGPRPHRPQRHSGFPLRLAPHQRRVETDPHSRNPPAQKLSARVGAGADLRFDAFGRLTC